MANRRLFLKQLGLSTLGASVLLQFPGDAIAWTGTKAGLIRTAPEQQSVSSEGILAFINAFESNPKIEPHSFMILRHGNVIAEGWWAPYDAPLKHTLYSLSKSFTSTAVGLAIAEGKLRLTDPVLSFFPDQIPAEVSDNLKAMQLQHLLMMGTGHEKDTIEELRVGNPPSWAGKFLSIPVKWEPGTHFVYNTGSTYMQSAIVQKVTGMKVIDYLQPRLFQPLGIEGMDWEENAEGINVGGYGLRVKTEDIAKLGQLYLQKGMWNGKRILPESWTAEATTAHIDNTPAVPSIPKGVNDWSQGYGYQFWRCTHNGFRGDGAFGQFCIVLPEKDAVIVMTSESFDLQASMNLVWDHLFPAFHDQKIKMNKDGNKVLAEKIKNLQLNPPAGSLVSSWPLKIADKNFVMESNEFLIKSISFHFSGDEFVLHVDDATGSHSVVCGLGKWGVNEGYKTQDIFPIPRRPVVTTRLMARAVWQESNSLLMTWRFVETAHSDNITFTFTDNQVQVKFLNSVTKGNPGAGEKRNDLKGVIAS